MGGEGETVAFLGAMVSSIGFCENPNKLEISMIKVNTNFLAIFPNLAVKIIKSW